MRITHLNTYEASGGAARAAARLHEGLSRLGHDSRLLVAQAEFSKAGVIAFVPPGDMVSRLRRLARRIATAPAARQIAARPTGSNFFSDDRSLFGADVLRQLPASDVVNLHWISGFADFRDFFRGIAGKVPLVWTLHDMNPFTGGCHTDGECGKYREQCGACPQMESKDPDDLSSQIWRRKHRAYASIPSKRMRIVTPSRWMAGEARNSTLLGRFSVSVIPNGLDTERFQPRSRQCARELFGISPEARVALFVAAWVNEKQKGLGLLREAVCGLEDIPGFCAFVIGRGVPQQALGPRAVILDYVRDELLMSQVYSAADVFVAPSFQDNFPNTALEALACGTPTVAFSVGGLQEIVRAGRTGILVPRGDVQALREAIAGLLRNPERRASFAEASRETAVEEYSLEVQAKRYLDLYSSMVGTGPIN